jgi:hypothetical protein
VYLAREHPAALASAFIAARAGSGLTMADKMLAIDVKPLGRAGARVSAGMGTIVDLTI